MSVNADQKQGMLMMLKILVDNEIINQATASSIMQQLGLGGGGSSGGRSRKRSKNAPTNATPAGTEVNLKKGVTNLLIWGCIILIAMIAASSNSSGFSSF